MRETDAHDATNTGCEQLCGPPGNYQRRRCDPVDAVPFDCRACKTAGVAPTVVVLPSEWQGGLKASVHRGGHRFHPCTAKGKGAKRGSQPAQS
jgi:hypothetical protein